MYTPANAEECDSTKRKNSSSFQIDETLEIDNNTKINDPNKFIANKENTPISNPISNDTEKMSNKILGRSSSLDNSRKLQPIPLQNCPSLKKIRLRKSTGMETKNPQKCIQSKRSNISEVMSCSQSDTRRSTSSSPKIGEKRRISLTRDKCTRESAHLPKHNKNIHTITKSDTAKPFHVDR